MALYQINSCWCFFNVLLCLETPSSIRYMKQPLRYCQVLLTSICISLFLNSSKHQGTIFFCHRPIVISYEQINAPVHLGIFCKITPPPTNETRIVRCPSFAKTWTEHMKSPQSDIVVISSLRKLSLKTSVLEHQQLPDTIFKGRTLH